MAARSATAPLVQSGQVPLLYLDANILIPQYLRAIFLDLADAGLVRVHWGQQVLAEVRRNLVKPRFGLTPAVVDKQLKQWLDAFPDAMVLGSEPLEERFVGKTDRKDTHVAAGAFKLSEDIYGGQAVLLVSQNIKHLPVKAFSGTAVRPARPGSVLNDLLTAEQTVSDVLDAMLTRFRKPRVSREDLLMILDHSNCRAFATALASRWGFQPQRP